jgi:hypothetical protein
MSRRMSKRISDQFIIGGSEWGSKIPHFLPPLKVDQ